MARSRPTFRPAKSSSSSGPCCAERRGIGIMTVLTVGRPFTSPDATLLVENQLAVGAHLFQLVVVDDDGLASDPVQATVQVVDLKLPPVIIQPPVVLQP